MASLPVRHYLADGTLVSALWPELPGLRINDARTGRQGRPHDDLPLVQAYSPELDQRCRPYPKPTNDSWRTDETYVKVRGKWKYLYRAVDSEGNTLDFLLSAKRNTKAAKRFFKKVLNASHTIVPRVITVDKNAAYPPAIETLKRDKSLPKAAKNRQRKYLNNIVEQDHRFLKRRTRPGLRFSSFNTARRTLK